MYINQQGAQNSVIRLYIPLDALHVSDYISPSSGATFYKLYIAFGICRYMLVPNWYTPIPNTSGCSVTIATQQPDVYRHIPNAIYSLHKKLLLMMD